MALTVAVEGLPGSGKTTVIRMLASELRSLGLTVEVVDIDSTGCAPILRPIVKAYPLGHPARILLFWVLRLQQYEAMQAWAGADVVFADRFLGSTVAYDAYGHGLPRELLHWLGQYFDHQPDITFLFEAPLAVVRKRKKTETMDDPGFAERVEQGYQKLADALSWTRVDATQEPDCVAEFCFRVIQTRLSSPP
jgi:dTMP kinase